MTNQTLLEALPELNSLENYFEQCRCEDFDIDTNIVLSLTKNFDEKIRELEDEYDLRVDEREYSFTEDLIEFMDQRAELIKEPLPDDMGKTYCLSDAINDITLLKGLTKHLSNGTCPCTFSYAFLLLVRATMMKLEYFQEKYNWTISDEDTPGEEGEA